MKIHISNLFVQIYKSQYFWEDFMWGPGESKFRNI